MRLLVVFVIVTFFAVANQPVVTQRMLNALNQIRNSMRNTADAFSKLGFFGVLKRGFHNYFNLPAGLIKYLMDDIEFNGHELDDTDPPEDAIYDFIVVGAGSSGAALASRLSEVREATVLLIEAGGRENRAFGIPLTCLYLQALPINWDFRTEPSNRYCLAYQDNSCYWPRGKVMGGTSTINAMIATRGNPEDYNKWARAGNPGWSYEEVLKYFIKLENNLADNGPGYDPRFRGKGGPMTISYNYQSPVAEAFVKAGAERGYPVRDYNGPNQIGFSFMQANIRGGERLSSNRAYLHPIKGRPNLFLTRESHVTNVNIDENRRAVGVSYIKRDKVFNVRARKEVILSAGAFNSPQILMLSGLGPAEHLRQFGIPLVQDMPGVGQNLQDHVSLVALAFLINTTDTISLPTFFAPWETAMSDFMNHRKGPFATASGIEAIAFANVETGAKEGPSDVEFMYSDISAAFNAPLYKYVLGMKDEYSSRMYDKYANRYAFMGFPVLLHPKSRGQVLLRSRHPKANPRVIANYFEHPDDVRILTLGIREYLAITQQPALQKFGATLVPDKVLGCEKWPFNSDGYWECAMRTLTYMFWHFIGTAKMGPGQDPMAVVDHRLRVLFLILSIFVVVI